MKSGMSSTGLMVELLKVQSSVGSTFLLGLRELSIEETATANRNIGKEVRACIELSL
jgi:hypothetical protein